MGSPFLEELKKQASCFFKDKLNTARLVLTDATPVQLMTEDATNGNSWPPDTRAIGVISRSAFEVDDYFRIVEILHTRLLSFDRKNWRGPYKALIILEHLLTHGPLRVADEFKDDIIVIQDYTASFQYIDEKGFNWGLSVSKLLERVSKLIENPVYLKEERGKARNLTRGIEGFGSFIQRSSPVNSGFVDLPPKVYARCNSEYNNHRDEDRFFGIRSRPIMREHEVSCSENHPFCDNENQTAKFLHSV